MKPNLNHIAGRISETEEKLRNSHPTLVTHQAFLERIRESDPAGEPKLGYTANLVREVEGTRLGTDLTIAIREELLERVREVSHHIQDRIRQVAF